MYWGHTTQIEDILQTGLPLKNGMKDKQTNKDEDILKIEDWREMTTQCNECSHDEP